MPATFDKILGKPLLHTHQASDISGLSSTSDSSTVITADQTVTQSSANIIFANCLNNPITISLPTAASVANKFFKIKKIDNTLNQVIVVPNGQEKIDGDSSIIISYQNTTVDLVSDGNNWYIL